MGHAILAGESCGHDRWHLMRKSYTAGQRRAMKASRDAHSVTKNWLEEHFQHKHFAGPVPKAINHAAAAETHRQAARQVWEHQPFTNVHGNDVNRTVALGHERLADAHDHMAAGAASWEDARNTLHTQASEF